MAKSAANKQLKTEIANELGVNLENGAQLTTRDAGSVGGNMVKRMVAQYQGTLVNGQSKKN